MDHEVRELFEEITPETEYTRYANDLKTGRKDKSLGISDYLEVLSPEGHKWWYDGSIF